MQFNEEITKIESNNSQLERMIDKHKVITSDVQYKEVDGIGNLATAMMKEIDSTFEPIKSKQYAAWKETCEQQKRHKSIPDAVRRQADRLMSDYREELERKAREEQKRQEELARKEEERLRKIKEEQERAWREKEEQKRKEAEELAKQGREEEARKLQEQADKCAMKAEERSEEAHSVFVPAQVVNVQAPKLESTTMREKWEFEITDMNALIDNAISNPMLRPLLAIDEKQLRKLVETYKSKFCAKGVRVFSRKVVSRAV